MSGTAPPPSLDDLVARIAPRHVFLIYAGHGGGGEELNADYYRAASRPEGALEDPRGGPCRRVRGTPATSTSERVIGFFDRALLGEE